MVVIRGKNKVGGCDFFSPFPVLKSLSYFIVFTFKNFGIMKRKKYRERNLYRLKMVGGILAVVYTLLQIFQGMFNH